MAGFNDRNFRPNMNYWGQGDQASYNFEAPMDQFGQEL